MGQGPSFPQLNLVYVAAKLAGMLQLELELELQCRRTWLELPALARGMGTHPAVEFPQPTCPSLIYSFPSMAFRRGCITAASSYASNAAFVGFYGCFDRSFD